MSKETELKSIVGEIVENIDNFPVDQVSIENALNNGGLMPIVSDLKEKFNSLEIDPSTKEGLAQIRTLASKISTFKKRIENPCRDHIKGKKKQLEDLIKNQEKEVKLFTSALDAFRIEFRKPLTELEEKEKAEKAEKARKEKEELEELRRKQAEAEEIIRQQQERDRLIAEAKLQAEEKAKRLEAEKKLLEAKAEEERRNAEIEKQRIIEEENKKRIQAQEEANRKLEEQKKQQEIALEKQKKEMLRASQVKMNETLREIEKDRTTATPERRKEVNEKIISTLISDYALSSEQANKILRGAVTGRIPNLSVDYSK